MNDPIGLIGRAGGVPMTPGLRPPAPSGGNGPTFAKVLEQNLAEVNQLQMDAEKAIEDLAAGRRSDVTSVMIAKQKADTALKALLQVRNKLQDAYNEVKEMRV